jgi:hypothetical protein
MSLVKRAGKIIVKNTGKLIARNVTPTSAAANAYIAAVEAADGSSLEVSVKQAIHSFFDGCEQDNILSSIKAACLMTGPKTLQGALVPLIGPAPTNFNFVAGDYDRKTGLKGDAMTKYLNTNCLSDVTPANDYHQTVYATELNTQAFGGYIGHVGGDNDYSQIMGPVIFGITYFRNRHNNQHEKVVANTGLLGTTRNPSSSSEFTVRANQSLFTQGQAGPTYSSSINTYVFKQNWELGNVSNARLAWYSIGSNIDLEKLENRLSIFKTTINSAI